MTWWSMTCPHCRTTVEVYLEEADGTPSAVPLHLLPGASTACPGSGQWPDDAEERAR